jgi:hypothetical protein
MGMLMPVMGMFKLWSSGKFNYQVMEEAKDKA